MGKQAFVKQLNLAGLLLFVAGIVVFMGIITAESYYPALYTTRANEISDLGATRPPNSIIYQPSALIFNLSMIATGLLVLIAVNYLVSSNVKKSLTIPLCLFGFGVLGVGLFPGNTTPHPYFAILTFASGGLAAVLSSKSVQGYFRYVAIGLGVVALVALFFSSLFVDTLGAGGIERWIAYPITLWMTGYGGYLLGTISKTSK